MRFVEPGEGYLACGWIGKGRLAEPAEIVEAALAGAAAKRRARRRRACWSTAGPTLEDIDPVRFIGNRSSGKMGYAHRGRSGAARRARDVGLGADEDCGAKGATKSFRCAARARCIGE